MPTPRLFGQDTLTLRARWTTAVFLLKYTKRSFGNVFLILPSFVRSPPGVCKVLHPLARRTYMKPG